MGSAGLCRDCWRMRVFCGPSMQLLLLGGASSFTCVTAAHCRSASAEGLSGLWVLQGCAGVISVCQVLCGPSKRNCCCSAAPGHPQVRAQRTAEALQLRGRHVHGSCRVLQGSAGLLGPFSPEHFGGSFMRAACAAHSAAFRCMGLIAEPCSLGRWLVGAGRACCLGGS
jgi:hypothetical protein